MQRHVMLLCICGLLGGLLAGPGMAQEPAFTISTSYKSLLSNSEQTGLLDRLHREAFRRIGIEVTIVFTPTERSLMDVNAGLLDAEVNRIEGMERSFANLIRVPEPNMTMHFVAFARQPYTIAGWESLRELHIGIVSGWRILETHTQGFPHVTLTPTEVELFSMLDKNRIDVALYDMLTGYEKLRQLQYPDIRHLTPPLASRDMYLYLHKKHAALAPALAEALRTMKQDGAYDQIVEATTAHLELNLN